MANQNTGMVQMSNKHSEAVIGHWERFCSKLSGLTQGIAVDGHNLDIATLVAVARHGARVYLDNRTLDGIKWSADTLHTSLREGQIIYGVNTGFGGSADTRTRQVEELQRTLIRELHCGIIVESPERPERNPYLDRQARNKRKRSESPVANGHGSQRRSGHVQDKTTRAATLRVYENGSKELLSALQDTLPTDDQSTSMPDVWVRASILVRVNSLASAHSGVKPDLITNMTDLLKFDILPKIPLRGSISASGDLSPLSYIAGTIMGKPTITVTAGSRKSGQRRATTADVALAEASISPIRLGPKEGLAIVNGTAVSTAVGALAVHDANGLAILSQVLTAMSVEALCGTSESFDPFFAKVRPHAGQMEAGHNIYQFLRGSQLIQNPDGTEEGSLRQDRYSIRTASQWIGPLLEDLLLAHQQVTVECNSVTDNPLIDGKRMLHGGNFQAKSITSATEKIRVALESIGRMLFTQCTELINPTTNRGLPPNLVAEEPNSSWVMKAIDIMIAALQSELGFLANPVGSHVQTAEMGNQSLNSLALISARYCHSALDVLSQLAAAHLFALCQAFDLRAMHISFLEAFRQIFQNTNSEILAPLLKESDTLESLQGALWTKLTKTLNDVTNLNTAQRFDFVIMSLQPILLRYLSSCDETIPIIENWTKDCSESMLQMFETNLDLYSAHPDATQFLGNAGKRMYTFVRQTLGVPFLRAQNYRTPDPEPDISGLEDDGDWLDGATETANVTTGSFLTTIYSAIRNGSLYVPVMECLREAQQTHEIYGITQGKASKPEKVVDSLVSESKIGI